ncbi:hypothetical protein ACFL35_20980 [Candidatus Riflebacteria bacterium]
MKVAEFIESASKSHSSITSSEIFYSSFLFGLLIIGASFMALMFFVSILGTIGFRGALIGFTILFAFVCEIFIIYKTVAYLNESSPVIKKAFNLRIASFLENNIDKALELKDNGNEVNVFIPGKKDLSVKYINNFMLNAPISVAGSPVSHAPKNFERQTYYFELIGPTQLFKGKNFSFQFCGLVFGNEPEELIWMTGDTENINSDFPPECIDFIAEMKNLLEKYPLNGALEFNSDWFTLKLYDLVKGVDSTGAWLYGGLSKKAMNRWKQKGHRSETISYNGANEILRLIL